MDLEGNKPFVLKSIITLDVLNDRLKLIHLKLKLRVQCPASNYHYNEKYIFYWKWTFDKNQLSIYN